MIVLLALIWGLLVPASSQEVTAVVSSRLGPYEEALRGLKDAWSRPLSVQGMEQSSLSRDTHFGEAVYGSKKGTWSYKLGSGWRSGRRSTTAIPALSVPSSRGGNRA